MTRIATILLVCILPLIAAAQEAEKQPFFAVPAAEAELGTLLWQARPLVVFADSAADPRFAEQMELLAADFDQLADRDVIVIVDTDPAEMTTIRTELRPRGFMLALVAKDGSVIFRKPTPWDVREISRAIDKQPLRKQELVRERAVTD